jgi:hypothetical protein
MPERKLQRLVFIATRESMFRDPSEVEFRIVPQTQESPTLWRSGDPLPGTFTASQKTAIEKFKKTVNPREYRFVTT